MALVHASSCPRRTGGFCFQNAGLAGTKDRGLRADEPLCPHIRPPPNTLYLSLGFVGVYIFFFRVLYVFITGGAPLKRWAHTLWRAWKRRPGRGTATGSARAQMVPAGWCGGRRPRGAGLDAGHAAQVAAGQAARGIREGRDSALHVAMLARTGSASSTRVLSPRLLM